jgi:hypothetical protein
MKWFRVLIAAAIAMCLLPMASLLLALLTANIGGCQLDEGSEHPCLLAGHDLGSTLYAMSVGGGWIAIAALPVLGSALLFWAAVEVFHHLFARRRSA